MTESIQSQPNQTTALATTINLPLFVCPEEIILAAKENQALGERFPFDKIKMPSGGGLSFELIDEDGKPKPIEKLTGIILGFKPFRSWYQKSFNERTKEDDPYPDCYSSDLITGSGNPAKGIPACQKCESCPYGQWGSSRTGGRGKDCADRMGMWILLEGYGIPHFIPIPKTSLGSFKDYRKRLTAKGKVFYGVVTAITLDQKENANGVKYSHDVFAKAAELTPQERAQIKNYIDQVSHTFQVTREAITVDEAEMESMDGADGSGIVNESGSGIGDINNIDFSKPAGAGANVANAVSKEQMDQVC